MSQAQTFYEGHSFYEGLTWWFVRERIGQGLRERYQVPKELPAKLLALIKKLDAIESKSPRARNRAAYRARTWPFRRRGRVGHIDKSNSAPRAYIGE